MLSRRQAIEIAAAHLREEGSSWRVRETGLRRNNRLGFWAVGYIDLEHPDATLAGGEFGGVG